MNNINDLLNEIISNDEEIQREIEIINDRKTIDDFRRKNHFLSNFYNAKVEYNGLTYENNEAAFQAQKDLSRSAEFTKLPPNEAKRLGRKVKLRKDWNDVRVSIMYEIVFNKFCHNTELREKLINTGDSYLIEGNTWNDKFWGVCKGEGRNELGKILESVRFELKTLKDK